MKWLLWAILLLAQQLSQTLSMRSRATGSYRYHAVAAMCSNGVWWVSQLILVDTTVKLIAAGSMWQAFGVGAFYTLWCTTGSTAGMWLAHKVEARCGAHVGD